MAEEGEVVFTARYKTWMTVKKLSIDEKTTPQEVAAALASAEATMNRKSYELTGINQAAIEAMAEKLSKGKRKSFVSLSEALTALKPTEIKTELLAACPTPAHLPIAENYLMKCMLDNMGFKTNLDLETLSQVYPEIKVPKPRGNFGKKKKA
ncbi:Uncharacterised protein [uncultured archaeon]|nr:Uncharacterised protein [uncultured archaeon]